MTRDLSRLLNPKSIAVIGGGAWCEAIIGAAHTIGFQGDIFPVHPSGKTIAGLTSFKSLADWPGPIDAAFIGVNRHATLGIVADLAALDVGGAICFASGFSEAAAEDTSASDLQAELIDAAGQMPILGPNCYGFLNAFDGAAIWPDQHGCRPIDRGVAILTQSSNIAINLTMQSRALPIGYVVTCGNQAQTSQARIASQLLDDPRVTALGLHIEGFGDLRPWEALAAKARAQNIPLIALKSGKSTQAQSAAVSHTASLTGSDAGAQAFLDRLGIIRVSSLPTFLEALKVVHLFGHLPSNRIASISCSGGEAALAADTATTTHLTFPPLNPLQTKNLGNVLGPMVALANPLDYHTYIWRDEAAMTAAWAAMSDPDIAITLLIIDYPRADICDASDWTAATAAAIAAAAQTGGRYAVVATLPELLPEDVASHLMANGVLPLHGLDHALPAISALTKPTLTHPDPVLLPGPDRQAHILTEAQAKHALAAFDVPIPNGENCTGEQAVAAANSVGYPVAVKVLSLAHKTGANGLALNLQTDADLTAAIAGLAPGDLLIEHMVQDTVAEVLIGVTRDPAHGFVLTLAAGGTLTELLADSAQLLIPASNDALLTALNSLRCAPLLHGHRGAKPADMSAILRAINGVQNYVLANAHTLEEVEINPLICTPTQAIAADALIRKAHP